MAESESRASQDVALLYAPTEDGTGARVLRARNGTIETGEVRPAKEGQPFNNGELVRLKPRSGSPSVCDVEVIYRGAPLPGAAPVSGATPAQGASESAGSSRAPQASGPARGGPAQVATESYRDNWDRIFGSAAARRRSALN